MSDNGYLKCSCQKCSGHIEFPPGGAGETVSCPHCGEETRLISSSPNYTKIIFMTGTILALVVLGFASVMFHSSKHKKTEVLSPETVAPAVTKTVVLDDSIQTNDFKIGKISLKKTEGTALVYAVGIVKNETDRQRFGVKIQLDLVDAQDNAVGATSDYIEILEPKKQWQFKALLTNPKAVKAMFVKIEEQK